MACLKCHGIGANEINAFMYIDMNVTYYHRRQDTATKTSPTNQMGQGSSPEIVLCIWVEEKRLILLRYFETGRR